MRGFLISMGAAPVDIIVSNRVARVTPGGPMMGGLASALLPAVRKSGVVWFGSSGNTRRTAPGATPFVRVESYGRGTIATVDLPDQHYCGFYEGYSNSALWPLLHSRPDLVRISSSDYRSYLEVNAYMARTLAAFGDPDATFWIHDYHFLPLARNLRELGVTREIGFFLHTPWPERHVIAQLPQYRELAHAMLAYDLIGFQTDADRDNFADMLRHDLHQPGSGLVFRTRRGTCRLATFPIGIDVREFAASAERSLDDPEVRRLRASLDGAKLIMGVDRLDYSKGLTQRIQGFDRLLTQRPELCRQVTMLQIAVPSRCTIDTYRDLQSEVARLIGEVNGAHGEIDWTPLRYITKGYGQATLAGFYRVAAIGLVTPLRDGMNLVAKEYVAAQNPDDPGVLVLSKFAGAARELDAALLVDPCNPDAIATQISSGLAMPRSERRARWQQMVGRLTRHSIHRWFASFLEDLKTPRPVAVPLAPAKVPALVPAAHEHEDARVAQS
jgi:trehalose 6-phosphate synthase